ncbi:sensor histidine kinase [Oleiharenicola sp. Vm1]|uniref:sensor histidine kinase n=1 Tax=Oleiharenicola sp. Vm1 TaxID=3398393 RepID=UPI0039F62CC6
MVSQDTPSARNTVRLWARVTEWTLNRITGLPKSGRTGALVWIGLFLVGIGFVDYVTGTRVSMGFFYLVPVALSVVWLGLAAGSLAALASWAVRMAADLTDAPQSIHETWLWWNSASALLTYFSVIWILHALIQLHRQLEQRVQQRTTELERETLKRQQVQRELLELSESERSAMGRELHDQLGQHLVGTAMAAQVLAHRLHGRDESGAREARKIADLVEQGIAQTRQLARGLLLERVEPERLKSELEELCAGLRQQFPAVECVATVDTPAELRDASRAAQVFRIAQEALRNACRHSGAKRVALTLRAEHGDLLVVVEDDGRGLPPQEERSEGMGLRIMQHRAEHLGSDLMISAQRGRGTRVMCRVPLGGPVRFSHET